MPIRARSKTGSPDISHLAEELRQQIGRLRRRLRAEADPADLTAAQVSVITRLFRDGPATVSALARGESMRPQSMGAIVSALEAIGFVEGAPDERDRRQTVLSLTRTCRRWIDANRAARHDWLSKSIREHLAPHELRQLSEAIELLKRLVD